MSEIESKICKKCGMSSVYEWLTCSCSCHFTTGMMCD